MTALYTQTPAFFGDICEELRLFIDTRRIDQMDAPTPPGEGYAVVHDMDETGGRIISRATLYCDGEAAAENSYSCEAPAGELEHKRTSKRAAKISVYRALRKHFGTDMPWGSLTGIRPTRLLRDSEAALGPSGARSLFLDEFDVSQKKYDFAREILDRQTSLLPDVQKDIDIYIGIPFCVSRCAYCSFASNTPDVFKDAEQKYIDALMSELDSAEELIKGRRVRALYIGGGTPTALRETHLEKVVARAAQIGGGTAEFTVEAGRPDTITKEKLEIIRAYGANRISVNAQTMKDDTLMRIGRRHTAAQFLEAYHLARGFGFDVINADVIAGLPGETVEDVEATLQQIIGLAPENITVHTLAVKRASVFAADNMDAFPTDAETARMIDIARDALVSAGYGAYYMYRQKYMKGSLENAGYTRPGGACLYNIDNMEELCSVVAFGAGAISKRIFSAENRIERAANVKDLREYIARYEQMAEAKKALFAAEE